MRLAFLVPVLIALAAPVHAADDTATEATSPILPAITVSTVESRMLQDRVIVSGLVKLSPSVD